MKNFLYEYPAEISYTQSQQTRNTEEWNMFRYE
jgi:hypothetical protein